jgi:hypothetical protein
MERLDAIDASGNMDLVMVESSSAKEEDGEFECKKANEDVISICLGDSFLYPLLRCSSKHRV